MPEEADERKLGERGRVERRGTVALAPGDTLPDVSLHSTAGGNVSPAEVAAEHHVVLVFYPGDREGLTYPELMGCTPQACGVRDALDTMAALGAVVYGANFHAADRQREFVEREGLAYDLLCDAEETLANALGLPVWVSDDGERFAARTTVIVERGGKIAHVLEEPDVETHAAAVVERLRSLAAHG